MGVMVGAALLALSLVVPPQSQPIGKLTKGPKVVFKLQANGQSKNEFILEPMLPVSIFGIVGTVGGESPQVGDIFQCKAGTKTLGYLLNDAGKPSQSTTNILILDCGKYKFFIEGIQFTPE